MNTLKKKHIEFLIQRFEKSTGTQREIFADELDKISHPDLLKISYQDGKKEYKLRTGQHGKIIRMTRIPLADQLSYMKEGKTPFD